MNMIVYNEYPPCLIGLISSSTCPTLNELAVLKPQGDIMLIHMLIIHHDMHPHQGVSLTGNLFTIGLEAAG
jgi:hypothetical protein